MDLVLRKPNNPPRDSFVNSGTKHAIPAQPGPYMFKMTRKMLCWRARLHVQHVWVNEHKRMGIGSLTPIAFSSRHA